MRILVGLVGAVLTAGFLSGCSQVTTVSSASAPAQVLPTSALSSSSLQGGFEAAGAQLKAKAEAEAAEAKRRAELEAAAAKMRAEAEAAEAARERLAAKRAKAAAANGIPESQLPENMTESELDFVSGSCDKCHLGYLYPDAVPQTSGDSASSGNQCFYGDGQGGAYMPCDSEMCLSIGCSTPGGGNTRPDRQ